MTRHDTAPIADICVEGRARNDLGDLGELTASILALGLLQPVVVTSTLRLIAGQRRLAACAALGWTEIPVRVASDLTSAVDLLRAERDENTCRLALTPSEKVALGMKLEALVRPEAAAARQEGNARGGMTVVAQPGHDSPARVRTADRVGAAVGLSRTTYKRAKRIVVAAEAGDSKAKEALKKMDDTGRVAGAYEDAFEESARRRRIGSNRDRLRDALAPLDHYLKTFDPDHHLRGLTPKEARSLLKTVQRIDAAFYELERGLADKSLVSRALK